MSRRRDPETQTILDVHASYQRICEAAALKPLELNDFIMVSMLSALGPEMIPYLTPLGTTWVHNVNHKTNRQDRPFDLANHAALVMTPERKGRKVVGFHFDITQDDQVPLDLPLPEMAAGAS